jgi:hypothetical protein
MAARKKLTVAEKLRDGEKVIYELAGASFHEEAGALSCTLNGVTVAHYSFEGDDRLSCELLFTPALEDLLRGLARHYSAGSHEGFLRFVLGKDPRPALDAKRGMAIGLANRDVKQLGAKAVTGAKERLSRFLGGLPAAAGSSGKPTDEPALRSLSSLGGPSVVIGQELAARWAPKTGEKVLEACGDGATVVAAPGVGSILVLGTPDRVIVFGSGKEFFLVRVVSFDADDDGVLKRHLEHIDGKGFKKVLPKLVVEGPMVLFDSALSGKKALAKKDQHLEVLLEPGGYEVAQKTDTPDETTELLVVRLKAS